MKITKDIIQKGDKKHQDSFWFDGHVATLSMKDKNGDIRSVYIRATGDIRIHNKEGELVFDVKSRNSGFPEFRNNCPNDDKDLAKLEKFGYYWENNNWFAFEYDINDGEGHGFLGDFEHSFDKAIKRAEKALKDDKWWKELKNERQKI